MTDPFFDERPPDEGAATGGAGGSWIGGGAAGGAGGSATGTRVLLNRTASGALLADADGRIVFCRQSCPETPPLAAYIAGENTRGHGRCILIATSDPMRPASYSSWTGHDGTPATVAAIASWPLGPPGDYRIRARWQGGHYDYEKISQVKFLIYGISTGWLTLPLSGWATIATVIVADNYMITVNGQPGLRTGNKQLLET